MKNRILSLLLCCVMLVGLLPTVAYAEDSHPHCICGGSVTAGDHTAHSSVTFQPWDGTSAITYKNNVAYVYLTNDATINENLQISGGKTLYLCLNGKNYHSNGTNKIVVKENSRFVLCDCVGTGNIKGVKKGWGGGAVYLYNSRMDFFSGCFGTYVTNFSKGGGAVALDDSNCVLNVYGGSFQEIMSKNGGAVYMNGGTMNVYGGTFLFNFGKGNGGAIYMNDGTLNIQGGLFDKNGRNASGLIITDLGGAIYVNKGTLNINGGTFISNGASNGGGAIYMNDGTLNISGNPKIEDNKSGMRVGGYLKEYLNNLFLVSGKALNINGSLSADAHIGITTADTAYPVVFTNACSVNYADRFFSDNAELRIAYNNGKKLHLYEPIKYEVTVTGDGNGNVSASPSVAKSETEITLNATPDAGYHFKEWQVISGGVTVTDNKFIMPESNVNIRGIFEANTYTVTLNTGSGTIGNGNVTEYTYGVGATLPTDVTRTGYTFMGWYDNEGLAGLPVTEIGDTETGDKTYWARWSANTYTVTLNTGGGTIVNGNVTEYTYGTGATLPTVDDMSYTGHTFMGWYDNEGLAGSPVTAIGDAEVGDKAYWARWSANTYTVTLNTDGGTIGSGNVTEYTYGAGATLPTDITRTGYTFMGWYDNEGLAGDPVTAIGNSETGNKEYWASWDANTYIITVKPENDHLDIHITGYYGNPVVAPTLTRDGYEFIGWDREFPTTMPAENMTITAQWRDIEAPSGEIRIAENSWKSFLNNITFGLFFKDTQTVTVTAADNSSEAVTIEYLLSDKELSEAELSGMAFTAYSAPFSINPDNEYVIYAKLTDTSGNTAYINTDGIVLDATVPVISGIENGKIYCAAQTVTVTEKYLDTVKVNGTEVSLDENGSFVLSPASGEQTVVVTDKAGNETAVAVTVNNGHTGGTATCTKKAVCEICGESYGELDRSNHADTKHTDAKAATETSEGNIEYWHCEDCGKYFADRDGTKEITKADTVTAKLPEKKAEQKSPKTGDSVLIILSVLLLSGSACVALTAKRKRKDNAE